MTKSKGPVEGQTEAEVARLEVPPTTPTQPTSKRTRRQSRITDAFSVGRRSAARMTGKEGLRPSLGQVLASPTLRKRPEAARKSLEEVSEGRGKTTEEIVIDTSPLVGLQMAGDVGEDDDADEGEEVEGEERRLVESYEATARACLKEDNNLRPLLENPSNRRFEEEGAVSRSAFVFEEDIILSETATLPKRVAERAPAQATGEGETIVIHEDPPTTATTPAKELAVTMVATVDKLPAVPAYQRYAHLLSGPRPFALPAKFLLLEKILGALDSICMLSAGRNQPVIFHRALKSLEASVGRRVELVHLQQIVGLFGDVALGGALECYRLRPIRFVNYGKRISSLAVELPEETASHDYLLGRRTELLRRLTAKVAEHHDSFLDSINVSLPPGAKMRAWHPKFDVESVPDLEAATILPAEHQSQELNASQLGAAVPKEVAKAIIFETVDNGERGGDRSERPEDAPPETNSKGGGLLERIRAKQRATELAQMTHDPVREALRKKYTDLVEFSETVAMYWSRIKAERLILMMHGGA